MSAEDEAAAAAAAAGDEQAANGFAAGATGLGDLPVEVLQNIAFFLDIRSLCRLACTFKRGSIVDWKYVDCRRPNDSLWEIPEIAYTVILKHMPSVLMLPRRSTERKLGPSILSATVELPTLRRLDLTGNRIGVEGAQTLAAALKGACQIQYLDLRFNRLEDKGLEYLASVGPGTDGGGEGGNFGHTVPSIIDGLAQNKTLKHLNLRGNEIKDMNVCVALGRALATNSTLTTLILMDNELGTDGSVALVQNMLPANQTLMSLDLRLNVISYEGFNKLKHMAESRESLNILVFKQQQQQQQQQAAAAAAANQQQLQRQA